MITMSLEHESRPWIDAPAPVRDAFERAYAAPELACFYGALVAIHDYTVRMARQVPGSLLKGGDDIAMVYHPLVLREYLLSEFDRYKPAFLLGDIDVLLQDYLSEQEGKLRYLQSWVLGLHAAVVPFLWDSSVVHSPELSEIIQRAQTPLRVQAAEWYLFAAAWSRGYIHAVNEETPDRPLELLGVYNGADLAALLADVLMMIMTIEGNAGVAAVYHFNLPASIRLMVAAQQVVDGPPVKNLSDAILDAAFSSQDQNMMRREILLGYADAEGWTGNHLACVWRDRGLIGKPRRMGEDYDEAQAQKSAERIVRAEKKRRSGRKRRF